jgi:hypothetical protein
VISKECNPQFLVNLPIINVPRCVSLNAKTLGLQQFLDVRESNGPPGRTYVVHRGTDRLLAEQHTVYDRSATPVNEGAKHTKSFSRLSPYLVNVCRPDQTCIEGYPSVLLRQFSIASRDRYRVCPPFTPLGANSIQKTLTCSCLPPHRLVL